VKDDSRRLGERNWRNAARNRDSWQKLLKKALLKRGCCTNDDDDDDVSKNNSKETMKHICNFVEKRRKTNIVIVNVPH
jgi:hypothetical protein